MWSSPLLCGRALTAAEEDIAGLVAAMGARLKLRSLNPKDPVWTKVASSQAFCHAGGAMWSSRCRLGAR